MNYYTIPSKRTNFFYWNLEFVDWKTCTLYIGRDTSRSQLYTFCLLFSKVQFDNWNVNYENHAQPTRAWHSNYLLYYQSSALSDLIVSMTMTPRWPSWDQVPSVAQALPVLLPLVDCLAWSASSDHISYLSGYWRTRVQRLYEHVIASF